MTTDARPRRETLPALLERCLLASTCAATFAALLVVARNGLAPEQSPLTFGLVLWGSILLLYAAGGLAAFALLSPFTRVQSLAAAPRLLLSLGAVGFLAGTAAQNERAMASLASLGGPWRFAWLCPAGAGLAALGLLAASVLPASRRGPARLLALLSVTAVAIALAPPLGSRASAPPPASPLRARTTGERLLLIGLDGADWRYMEPLMARGDLPNLEALRDRGAWGELATVKPTMSPVIWTTIITGVPPEEHGIREFTNERLKGVQAPLPRLRRVRAVGMKTVVDLLRRRGLLFESPISSASRRVPAYWTIASALGSPLDVVNWWATWPAEPILGRMVSERVYFWRFAARGMPAETERLTHPEGLYREIAGRIMKPEEVGYEQMRAFADVTREEFEATRSLTFRRRSLDTEFRYFYSMFETERRLALYMLETGRAGRGPVPDLLWLCRLVDMACHTSLRDSDLVDVHPRATPETRARYGRTVTEAYRAADRAVGELVAAFGDGNVVVLSDHGFRLESISGGMKVYDHRWAPPGIFIAAGPAFRPGPVEGLDVFDVLPALLVLKGFPVAEDLPGRVSEAVFQPDFLAAHPVQRIPTYRGLGRGATGSAETEVDKEMLERLRALGYIE